MAKYEDYIQDEIDDAGKASDERTTDLPDQFVGKSAEEIAKDYVELQRLNSQQSNELGEARRSNAQLIEQITSVDSSQHVQEPEKEPVTVDDLYDDPAGTIKRVFDDSDIARELSEVRTELAQVRNEKVTSEFEGKFPTFKEDSQTAEMREWIEASPYRLSMAQKSDSGDIQAATELFSMYYDLKGVDDGRATDTRTQQLNDASLESGSTTMPPSVETFSRAELTNMRIMSKRGNMEAAAYMKANGAAITRAYEEGRIVD